MEKHFIKFADLPPNPLDAEDLKDYLELGMNTCLLTEDDVKLVKNGHLSDEYKQAIRNIADAGLQVWIRNMFNDADYFQCEAHKEGNNYGDPYEMEPRNITTEFEEFPAITGFYMADEAYMYTLPEKNYVGWMQEMPQMNDAHKFASFDKLTRLVDWKNKYYPNAFFHMNHVPGRSWDHFLPRNGEFYNYEDFLTEYCEVILKRLKGCGRSICLDNYPLIGEDYLESDYLQDIFTMAKVWRKYNSEVAEADKATLGICIQTFEAKSMFDERKRDIISPEEVTLQMYCGMALGARLFEYFCYHSYQDLFVAIKGPDRQKRIYHHVQEGIARTKFLEEVLCQFDSCGAFVVCGSHRSDNTLAFLSLKDLMIQDHTISVESSHDTLIGCFENGEKKGYMFVNYTDPKRKHKNYVTVHIPNAEKVYIYLNGKTQVVELSDNKEVCMVLPEGAAAFLVLE